MNTLIVALSRFELAKLSSGWERETIQGGLRVVVCLEEKLDEIEQRFAEEKES